MTEFVVGLKGADYVLLAADQAAMRSIIVYQQEYDKVSQVGTKLGMALCGETGDTEMFRDMIKMDMKLYEMKASSHSYNTYLTKSKRRLYVPSSSSNQSSISSRSRKPYRVNLMLGGYDDNEEKPILHYIDYMGASVECPYGAHGHGAMFTMSIMDRHYNRNAPPNLEEGISLIQRCCDELHRRYLVNMPSFRLKMINKDGMTELPNLKPAPLE